MSIESDKLMNLADGQVLYNDLRQRTDARAVIDDSAGAGDTDKTFSADKLTEMDSALKSAITSLDNSKAPVIIDSASGSIASISDGADDLPIESMTVQIEPVQDLHGQDSPYPPGGGKNLLNIDAEESTPNPADVFVSPRAMTAGKRYPGLRCDNYYYRNYVSYSVSNGVLKVTSSNNLYYGLAYIASCNGDESYTLSATLNNCNVSIGCYDSDWNFISTILTIRGTSPQTFTTPSNAAYVSVVFGSAQLGSEGTATNVQLEKGSATAYAPYSNICPISGWTGCNVSRTGKNLLNWEAQTVTYYGVTFTVNADGSIIVNGTATGADASFYSSPTYPYDVFFKTGSYIMSGCPSGGSTTTYFLNETQLAGSDIGNGKAFTLASDSLLRIRICVRNGVTVNNLVFKPMIRLASETDATYEPYHGTTYPITFDSAGTVYGGTINPVSGKLIVTHGIADLGTLTWALVDSTNHVFNASIPEDAYSIAVNETMSGACSSYAIVKANQFANVADNSLFQGWQGFYKNKWNIKDTAQSDASAFQTAMSGVMLVYPLAEPLEYDLTHVEITTLLGYNAIWADTGDVAVDYRADTRLFVEKTEVSGVQDVKVNGSSVVTDGVANVPVASESVFGAVKIANSHGIYTGSNGIEVEAAVGSTIKSGTNKYLPITPNRQEISVFYGLAKAAGDTTQASSSNAVGTYTESAKSAIASMLDAPETISGTTPSITAKAGVRYVCGECSTLTIVAPASGCIDVTFTSGSTATVLTVTTAKTGTTLKWANGFDPSSLDANTVYEINILDGEFGVVGQWT